MKNKKGKEKMENENGGGKEEIEEIRNNDAL